MLKVEKPEKVVWGSSKSFLALFMENLHKKNFFEPCRGVRIPKNEQIATGPFFWEVTVFLGAQKKLADFRNFFSCVFLL